MVFLKSRYFLRGVYFWRDRPCRIKTQHKSDYTRNYGIANGEKRIERNSILMLEKHIVARLALQAEHGVILKLQKNVLIESKLIAKEDMKQQWPICFSTNQLTHACDAESQTHAALIAIIEIRLQRKTM